MLVITECSCHIWIEDGIYRAFRRGRCGRCKQTPAYRGEASPTAKTVCLHDGEDCR